MIFTLRRRIKEERKKINIERGTVRVWELKKTHREREIERENEEVHKTTEQERKR